MEKDEQFKKRILELGKTAYQRSIVTFSDFLDLNEQNMVHSLSIKNEGFTMKFFGGYDMSERQMIAFLSDALSYEWEYPIRCLHIQPKSLKFSDKLTHRDYLGALLNLGVLRSKIGDIIVNEDNSAYVFCEERIADFFIKEVCKVKHTVVTVTEVFEAGNHISHKEELITGTVASIRLDSIIALAFGHSRSGMIAYIETGKVFVNGKIITSNGYTLKTNDVISVRGKGKFRFGGVQNTTRKGRSAVEIYRYI